MGSYIQRMATITLADGRKKRISARGKTEKEAILKLQRLQIEYEMGVRTINSNTTFRHWAEEWMEIYKKNKIQKNSYDRIKSIFNKYFFPTIGNLSLKEIKSIHLQKCLSNMSGLSNDLIGKAKNNITSCLERATIDCLINRNPALGLELPKGIEKKIRRSLTEEEKYFFLEACKKHDKGLLFLISYACGLRPQEARAIKWCNLDLKNSTISITNAVQSGSNTLKTPKSKAGIRIIPMPKWFLNELNILPQNINPNSFVFFGTNQQPMTKQRYERAWKSLIREMNIIAGAELYRNEIIEYKIDPSLTPYYLRHTYATELAEKQVDIKAAQYLLGHSSITMTADIYTHITNKMLEDATIKINNAI